MSSGLEALRIVLADDNPHMRSIVMTILNTCGVKQVREVADGAAGLDLLKEWPADLAVVDFKMAPMDGVEFTRQVRNSADSRNPYMPIIMMTGHSARTRVEEARDAGVTEFIVKPVTAKILLKRLQAAICKPRAFIHTATYFGPDRRRRHDPRYAGPWRRETDLVDRGQDTFGGAVLDDDLTWD